MTENKLKKFVDYMIKAYNNTSILERVTKVVDYDNQKVKFFQIGKRVLLPKKFFSPEDHVDNSFLASDFVRALVLGEKQFLVNHLIGLSKNNKIPSLDMKEFSYNELSEKVFNNVYAPTDIFIPIDWPYFNEVHNWIRERNIDFKDGLHIRIPHRKTRRINRIKVHWMTKSLGIHDIVVLDKKGIRLIQKKFEDIKPAKDLGTIIHRFGEGKPLRLDLAESHDPDKFDFVFRTVVAIDNINEKSVLVIKLPKLKNLSD